MSLPRNLPPECLSVIFSTLLQEHDTRSLARLLRVSKVTQAIALPLLYEDPFRFLREPHPHETHLPLSPLKSPLDCDTKLAKLLLTCVTDDQVLTGRIRFQYRLDTTTPPTINYLSYLKRVHLGVERFTLSSYHGPLLQSAVNGLVWAFCSERAEHLRSVTVNSNDIQRYLPIVDRFTSLTQIHIQHTMPQHGLENVALFLQEHMATIGTLQDIFIPGCLWPQQESFWQSLPLIDRPVNVDKANWDRFYSTVHQLEVFYIKSIQFPFNWTDRSRLESTQQVGPYLSRCRSLESYEAPFLGTEADSFRFAVKEKDGVDSFSEDPNRTPDGHSHQDHQVDSNGSRLMLRHFKTGSDREDIIPWLDEVMYAFSESLETVSLELAYPQPLQVNNFGQLFGHQPTIEPTTFGGYWSLPSLRKLEVRNRRSGITINTKFLANTPLLEELTLMDRDNTVHNMDEPFHLPQLKKLRLGGRVALRLHPMSLQSSPLLETLHLDCISYENTFSSRMWRRHGQDSLLDGHITDWSLPRLTTLELFGSFAMTFPLHALQFMPQVRTLFLDNELSYEISYFDMDPRRRFDLAGFTAPGSESDLTTKPTKSSVIQLPLLENLHLGGHWETDSYALQEVFSQVMPNLKCVSQLTKGIHGEEWMRATVSLDRVRYVRSSVPLETLDGVDIQEFGLRSESSHWRPLCSSDSTELRSLKLASWWPKEEYLQLLQERNVVQYEFQYRATDFRLNDTKIFYALSRE
ncbi:hypothetical protein B0O80DRAFT_495394 [Mortierella sp. GBAus27b]|nr:hypothetical protein BGX31_005881 [Mortierella sp. GBA43]KAI8358721.1 hypothetical protein B0O80DRAFT_495394 [Mortierella sp. GBAus27b]